MTHRRRGRWIVLMVAAGVAACAPHRAEDIQRATRALERAREAPDLADFGECGARAARANELMLRQADEHHAAQNFSQAEAIANDASNRTRDAFEDCRRLRAEASGHLDLVRLQVVELRQTPEAGIDRQALLDDVAVRGRAATQALAIGAYERADRLAQQALVLLDRRRRLYRAARSARPPGEQPLEPGECRCPCDESGEAFHWDCRLP